MKELKTLTELQNCDELPIVADLTQFDRRSLLLAGGKGANLGELTGAGFDVPRGFVVTTAAFDLLMQDARLRTLPRLLSETESGDLAAVTEIGRQIRAAVHSAPMPDRVRELIRRAYNQLGSNAVAVRSSATAEDLADAAFAGQQETLLNVIGEQPVLDAVRTCWASLWSERAILYRLHQGVDQAMLKLAVVVQEMVPADIAGVMFTADPVSGARDALIVDASPGLGEAVVAGLVTPDHFVLDKRRVRVRQQTPGKREVVIRARATGGTEEIPGSGNPLRASLPLVALRRLARVGIRIERHYCAPQDIEWAWISNGGKAGKLLILQARPMTALPSPLKGTAPIRRVLPMLAEMWPARPLPLDVTTVTGAFERAVGSLLRTLIGQSAPDPGKSMVEEDGVVVRFETPVVHPTLSLLITPWLTLWRTRRFDAWKWPSNPIIPEVEAQAQELNGLDLRALGWKENLGVMRRALALIPRVMQVREQYLPRALASLGLLWLMLGLAGKKDRLGTLIGGVETKTTKTNSDLEALAARIRDNGPLRNLFASTEANKISAALEQPPADRDFLASIGRFLDQYGHREVTLTISQGSWKDRPAIVFGLLKALSAAQPRATGGSPAWQSTMEELLRHPVLGRWPFRATLLKAVVNARSLIQIREDTHFYATLALPPARRVALELGRRLQRAAALIVPEDVFYLRWEEIEALGDPWPPSEEVIARVRGLVTRRRARLRSLASQPMFDPRLLSNPPQETPDSSVLLSGSPGSPGVAVGPARIVRDESEFGALRPGEVLIAPVTNPAWTPLFRHAAAVVVDTGGAASHAAIVAREYGVPAVMGTVHGTRALVDGQLVRVDGSRGLVWKAERSE